jgi:hypothetical protein
MAHVTLKEFNHQGTKAPSGVEQAKSLTAMSFIFFAFLGAFVPWW